MMFLNLAAFCFFIADGIMSVTGMQCKCWESIWCLESARRESVWVFGVFDPEFLLIETGFRGVVGRGLVWVDE
ncbi:hypothetical protein M758_5G085500 [Ceratodon purpureus]|nr:hypothetical protein M758_5G085500 [Ceratodon purpureus]